MALSEDELRSLEYIDRSLTKESPALARRLEVLSPPGRLTPLLASVLAMFAGLGLVVAAVSFATPVGPITGVLGFAVVVDSCAQLIRRVRGLSPGIDRQT